MTRLTDERIVEIERLSTMATNYQWDIDEGDSSVYANVYGELVVPLAELDNPISASRDIVATIRAIPDLLAEVKALRADLAQAEAERDVLAAELEENWPFLGGVMYAAAEMVSNGMDDTMPLEILKASGWWEEFEAHCNEYDVERFRQAVGEEGVNQLRCKQHVQQQAEKKD